MQWDIHHKGILLYLQVLLLQLILQASILILHLKVIHLPVTEVKEVTIEVILVITKVATLNNKAA